jgi:hypothetical protein
VKTDGFGGRKSVGAVQARRANATNKLVWIDHWLVNELRVSVLVEIGNDLSDASESPTKRVDRCGTRFPASSHFDERIAQCGRGC